MTMTINEIAEVCHEVNKSYWDSLGISSQPSWNEAPEWQRKLAIDRVSFHIENPNAPSEKSRDGWIYNYYLFRAVVRALRIQMTELESFYNEVREVTREKHNEVMQEIKRYNLELKDSNETEKKKIEYTLLLLRAKEMTISEIQLAISSKFLPRLEHEAIKELKHDNGA